MAIDWDVHVLAPLEAVFGASVTYTPAKGNAFSISGVFDEAYHEVILLDGAPPMNTVSPVLGVRLAEFPAGKPPLKGDHVTIPAGNAVYTVKDVRPDGHGHILLMLKHKSAIT
jgi:hypothetical protein